MLPLCDADTVLWFKLLLVMRRSATVAHPRATADDAEGVMRMVRECAIYLRVRWVTLQALLRRSPTQAAALLTPTTDDGRCAI